MRGPFMVFLLIGYCFLPTLAATAQEVVHALCGTVRSINPINKTIAVGMNNGTVMLFNESTKSKASLDFDKGIVHEEWGPRNPLLLRERRYADRSCIGGSGHRAIRREKRHSRQIDSRERVLTLKNNSGVEESFHLDPKTVAETPYGAMEGLELEAKDGDHLQVTASSVNGNETALFIHTM